MIRSPELVRCPVCGSKKINTFKVRGAAEMLCFCRGEGTVMESLDDRGATLSDPNEDRYSFDQTNLNAAVIESQVNTALNSYMEDESNGIYADDRIGITASKPRGLMSILSRIRSN